MFKRAQQDSQEGYKKKREILSLSNTHDDDHEGDEFDTEDELDTGMPSGRKALLKNQTEDFEAEVGSVKTKSGAYKQRTLLITSRGITFRYRHLMQDLDNLLPHSKKDAKLDSKSRLEDLNEVAELNNCNNCLYFETRKHQDMYLWMAKTPNGPSVKFTVKNIHTMDELKMTGNCLKGSRPILSFDGGFQAHPHLQLLQELFTHTFAVPKTSRKIKPFIDHVMSFSLADNKIWIRNFQILEGDAADAEQDEKKKNEAPISLVEIGPRFVLEIMRIFDASFGGSTLYENPDFITANNARRMAKGKSAIKHAKRQEGKDKRQEKLAGGIVAPNPIDTVFD